MVEVLGMGWSVFFLFSRRRGGTEFVFGRAWCRGWGVGDVDKKYQWKWGTRDGESYRKMLEFLDKQDGEKRQFAFHATITTHYPFDQMPDDQRHMFPRPRDMHQHMANSMHLVDQDIKHFFDELSKRPRFKNSLVIITGDHSWPTGEHGITINGNGYFEEFFKIPFIMYWPGEVEPQRVPGSFSQIDIAPTLCDVLNIDEPNHMLGQSMFAKVNDKPIHLIQPYAGTYLMAIKNQKKYVYHMQTKTELMYDLKNDPMETNDIFHTLSENQQQAAREWIRPIKVNQYLLKQNRIWPAN